MSRKRRHATASRASSAGCDTGTNVSGPSSPARSSPAPSEPQDKKSKFERRFDTANKSDEDILGMFIDGVMRACSC